MGLEMIAKGSFIEGRLAIKEQKYIWKAIKL